MNTFNENDFELNLYQFVDGELPVDKEADLFSELSQNESLRNELKELLSLKEIVKSDFEAFNPPYEVKSQLYKKIGLIPPTGIYNTSTLSLLLKRFAIPVASLLILSIATYFTLKYINKNQSENLYSTINKTDYLSNNPNDINNNSIINSDLINQNLPITQSFEPTNNINKFKENNKSNLQKVKNENKTSNVVFSSNNNDNKEYIINHKLQDNSDFYLINANSINLSKDIKNSINNNYHLPIKSLDYFPIKLYDFSFRGMTTAKSYPAITQSSAQEPFFTNFSLGVYMHQWDNFKIGAEFGQEPFGQEFKNQNQVNYVNKSSLIWGALGFQGNFDLKLLDNTQIFSRALIGATELGPLGKVIIGLNYQPEVIGIGIQLGLEGSIISYQNQGTNFLTKKIALTYGLSWVY